MKPASFEPAEFLTIDLDVRSRRSLAPLINAWPSAYKPMGADVRKPRWIILNPGGAKTAEGVAKILLRHIAGLRGEARQCWKDAYKRVFDIGIQPPGEAGYTFEEVRLTAETLKRIAAAGAQIQVTVYWARPESKDYIRLKRNASKRR